MNRWRTSLTERISYGLSDAADNLVFQMMTTYLLFFYTDVFGLTASEVAVLFVVARVADVFESLIIGVMIDNTHSKWGKSRPFFLWYAFPYVIFAILTFVTPNFLPHSGKLVWAYVTYLALGFLYTAVNLPITSILPTMTDNEQETTLLGVIRQFFGSSVQIIVGTFTIPLVALFGRGDQQKGFLGTIILFGIISLALILNTFFHVRERFTDKTISHQPVKSVWNMLKQNKPWMVISVVIFLYWLTTSIKNQTTIYYFKYVIKDENLVSWANGFTFTALIGVVAIYFVSAKLGKKNTMLLGIVTGFIGQVIISIGAYTEHIPTIFTGVFINSIGNGFIIGLVSIMIADTIRYGTSMGIQAEGVLASTDDFGVNLGLGLGGLITAGSLDVSGYSSNQAQSANAISAINLNYALIPLALYVIMFLVLLLYNETKINTAIKKNTN
ncbi:MFS transporter [Companilactobacillus sp.]|jgi:sugar (glycoside-pentoside-hexuronide) transporter|uniref:MFS transporter n=1 Tax=Companilactobacillus sp. TaxID=2767905 RepID=UPI0025B8B398|nr:MFS transporter [Companilactobacillus sp.]MCH4009518.1 MFS transporter [Companilactobacillus sp.]MCH4052806.1 MFS transporter [Companilactobacillus sp.]MCH4077460.1 MFS transporter [Companilactobacillus sp.]MCH4126036.1 MFS transporter [Companilactobacillus sp.]MCI1311744.1 MFS transporter [Companilactobacillus sp.]